MALEDNDLHVVYGYLIRKAVDVEGMSPYCVILVTSQLLVH